MLLHWSQERVFIVITNPQSDLPVDMEPSAAPLNLAVISDFTDLFEERLPVIQLVLVSSHATRNKIFNTSAWHNLM